MIRDDIPVSIYGFVFFLYRDTTDNSSREYYFINTNDIVCNIFDPTKCFVSKENAVKYIKSEIIKQAKEILKEAKKEY